MTTTKKPSWRDRPEYVDAEARWRKTGDIAFAALAIGRWYAAFSWPEGNAPEWALEACAELYEKALVGIEPVVKSSQGGRPHKSDYALLDRVARAKNTNALRDTASIFRSLLKEEQGLKGEQLEHSMKRLMRYWGPELDDPDGVPCNAHMNRVAKIDALAKGSGRGIDDFREDGTPSPKRSKPRRQSDA